MSLDIKFFKNEKGGSVRLGGGYITSGGLKANFSVFQSDKNKKYGFNIAFPFRKDKDDKIINEVQFTTQKDSDEAHSYIKSILDGKTSSSEPRVVTESSAVTKAGTTPVDVKANVKRFERAPF